MIQRKPHILNLVSFNDNILQNGDIISNQDIDIDIIY